MRLWSVFRAWGCGQGRSPPSGSTTSTGAGSSTSPRVGQVGARYFPCRAQLAVRSWITYVTRDRTASNDRCSCSISGGNEALTASDMGAQVEDYLSMRAALGFNVENHRWLLRDFVSYAKRVGHRGPMTIDLAVSWAISPCAGDAARGERALGAIRQFGKHRQAFEPGTAIPPVGLIGHIPRRRPPPHIYSEEEVSALVEECGRLRQEHLDRYTAVDGLMTTLVHTSHAALSDQTVNTVLVVDQSAEEGIGR